MEEDSRSSFAKGIMKHQIVDDVKVDLEFDRQDIEDIIDKVTESAVTLIVALTVSQVIKSYLTKGKHVLYYA